MSHSASTQTISEHTPRTTMLDDLEDQYEASFVNRWDELINWEKRKQSEDGFFETLLKSHGVRTVLDAAAGTGFHSIMFLQAGFDVITVDGSKEMLQRAIENGEARGLPIQPVHADWCELPQKIKGGFDAIVCLGSSFPHLFQESARKSTLKAFHALLRPGGTLIIDHRNFDAIRAQRYKSSGKYYYCGTAVSVCVDYADSSLCRFKYNFPDGTSHKLEVYPILKNEMRELLTEAGFDSVRTYGDFRADYDPFATDFYIHVSHKQFQHSYSGE